MKSIKYISLLLLIFVVSSCRISYSFRTASIDYDLTKTLTIGRFINQAPLVYPPLEQRFNESMIDMFTRNTKLQLVDQNGDMEIEGEIVGYQLTKTLTIEHFKNQTLLLNPPLKQKFNEPIINIFTRNTKQQLFDQNVKMKIKEKILVNHLTP